MIIDDEVWLSHLHRCLVLGIILCNPILFIFAYPIIEIIQPHYIYPASSRVNLEMVFPHHIIYMNVVAIGLSLYMCLMLDDEKGRYGGCPVPTPHNKDGDKDEGRSQRRQKRSPKVDACGVRNLSFYCARPLLLTIHIIIIAFGVWKIER